MAYFLETLLLCCLLILGYLAIKDFNSNSIRKRGNKNKNSKKRMDPQNFPKHGEIQESLASNVLAERNSLNHLGSCTTRGVGGPARNLRKCFEEAVNRWLPVRNKSIQKLRQLHDKVSENEAAYDEFQLNVKYCSQFCKKETVLAAPSSTWETFGSIGSLVSDVVGGLSSISHVIDIDSIQSKFQVVMDEDADATKGMHNARSKYFTEYRYTDEIIRKYGGTTLGETLEKISETIGITEFFHKIEKAKSNNKDVVLASVTALENIIIRNCSLEVGRQVTDAIQDLVDTNPAYVESAQGVGKVLYGVHDLYVKSRKADNVAGAPVRAETREMDMALITQEQSDIRELQRKIQRGSKTTIGRRIQEALNMFEKEKREILELLDKL